MEEEKELKDIKLGASFAYEGVIYECRPAYTCEGCILNPVDDWYGCCKPKFFVHCSALTRVDNRDVIFVEIGKEKRAVPKTEFALDECYFGRKPCDEEEKGRCVADSRSDGENVIFVEVKPENKEK